MKESGSITLQGKPRGAVTVEKLLQSLFYTL